MCAIPTTSLAPLTKRLSDASEAITELSDCVDTVQRTFAPQHEKELKLAIKSAWDKVCENCDLKKSCREEIRCPSDETIEKITQALSVWHILFLTFLCPYP